MATKSKVPASQLTGAAKKAAEAKQARESEDEEEVSASSEDEDDEDDEEFEEEDSHPHTAKAKDFIDRADKEIEQMRGEDGSVPPSVHKWLSAIGKKGRAAPPKHTT